MNAKARWGAGSLGAKITDDCGAPDVNPGNPTPALVILAVNH